MKKNLLFFLLVFGIGSLITACNSQTEKEAKIDFKVYGNCEMCKKTIESSLKDFKGVNSANWDVDKKIISVSFDSTKISEKEIHKQIAAAGYDTELEKGNDEAYKSLHECCQYERKK